MPPEPTSQTQSWFVYKGEIIKSKFRSYNLDVKGEHADNGAEIIGWEGDDHGDSVGNNQKWHFKFLAVQNGGEGESLISLLAQLAEIQKSAI